MKTKIFAIAAMMVFALAATAYDTITLIDGTDIKAKVESVTDTDVTYRKARNIQGPLYTTPISEIFMIRYESGDKDVFGVSAARQQPSGAMQPKSQSARIVEYEYPYPPVSRPYRIGDYFNEGGVEGVVFWTTEDGMHGLILGLKYVKGTQVYGQDLSESGPSSRSDGWYNLCHVVDYAQQNGLILKTDFPLYSKVIEDYSRGWYVPSLDEARLIVAGWNGGNLVPRNKPATKAFNNTLKEHGGNSLSWLHYILTSTEMNQKDMYVVSLDDYDTTKTMWVLKWGKNDEGRVRLIHKF